MPGILNNAERINADVLQCTFAGCPPIPDLGLFFLHNVGCSLSNVRVPPLIREENIDTVVLNARWTNVHRAS